METVEVMCPVCGEWFAVALPARDERPCAVDYDCEVCCRPMWIEFDAEGGALARGVGE